ncbi:MAG: hypothetical protein ACJAVI_001762 [Candidatus Azotimanducaceae bacterium]|jgi:hypothetical protein
MTKQGEIKALMERVGATFSDLDFEGWLNCFHSTHTFVHATVFSSSSFEESKAALSPIFKNMKSRGLKRTDLDVCNIKMLTETTAIVSTVWSRIDAEENLMEQLGATYLVIFEQNEWKVALVTGHGPDVIVVSAEP